eukprot:TRINITY_DN9313_c0_g3_i9.p1 TRINITY_DN9313_c0_g3~~TRINITY_DN9313_c0_g3_i9.p1  ORF type:complete len:185 (-),score=21.65 TRINITY_DN9313_c0_g3_i9:129-683(-)
MGRGSARRKNFAPCTPGPGRYNPLTRLLENSSPLWKICRSKRSANTTRNDSPDPGAYQLPSLLGQGPKIGFHGKRAAPRIADLPGPGAYDPSPKLISRNCPGIVVTTRPRMEKDFSTRKEVPGPGAYSLKSTLSGTRMGFGYGKKGGHKMENEVPGPGAYKIPCSFAKAERYKMSGKQSQFSFI